MSASKTVLWDPGKELTVDKWDGLRELPSGTSTVPTDSVSAVLSHCCIKGQRISRDVSDRCQELAAAGDLDALLDYLESALVYKGRASNCEWVWSIPSGHKRPTWADNSWGSADERPSRWV